MMLHRHFQDESNKEGMTTSKDVALKELPPDEVAVEEPKKRGRKKKTEE